MRTSRFCQRGFCCRSCRQTHPSSCRLPAVADTFLRVGRICRNRLFSEFHFGDIRSTYLQVNRQHTRIRALDLLKLEPKFELRLEGLELKLEGLELSLGRATPSSPRAAFRLRRNTRAAVRHSRTALNTCPITGRPGKYKRA